jgi:hypothetical protein
MRRVRNKQFSDDCRSHALVLIEIANESLKFKEQALALAESWLTLANIHNRFCSNPVRSKNRKHGKNGDFCLFGVAREFHPRTSQRSAAARFLRQNTSQKTTPSTNDKARGKSVSLGWLVCRTGAGG